MILIILFPIIFNIPVIFHNKKEKNQWGARNRHEQYTLLDK